MRCWFSTCLLLVVATAASGQEKLSPTSRKLVQLIDFQVEVSSNDPFALTHKSGSKVPEVRPGEVIKIVITGTTKRGHYTYPATEKDPVGPLSKIEFRDKQLFLPLPPLTESKWKVVEKDGIKHVKHYEPFTWTQELYVRPNTPAGTQTLEVTINLQVCDDQSCTGPDAYPTLKTTINVLKDDPLPVSAELQKRLDEAGRPPTLAKTQRAPRVNTPASGGDSLGAFLVAAFLGAFLMLLTPCVFPMIPITVNFFLKQSEKEHNKPIVVATIYSGTIIIVLSAAVLILGKVIVDLANDAWFNLILGGVLIFFALSLFGMYEIELPSFLARFTSAREGQGGYLGALFMALTFTITSFTCTGPFLGLLLGSIAGTRPPMLHLVLGAVVYSATFAAPFFVLALFPSILKTLPKSGGWMNTIKVTMGFLELAFALKFLANTDIAWFPGNPRLFNYDTVLVAWIVIAAACGLYLLGVFRLPHDDEAGPIGVVRLLFATLLLGLAIYMSPALLGGIPRGFVWENIVAFLPPSLKDEGHLDFPPAWAEAVKENKLIFIDFTGVNCTNCRDNEKNVFPKPNVSQALKKYVVVKLYTDTVPNPNLNASEAKQQAERNTRWRDTLGNPTLPYYLIFEPARDRPFNGEDLNGKVLGRYEKGTIRDIDEFVEFLEEPLDGRAALLRVR
jgi:thiol:disulfide interchange protein